MVNKFARRLVAFLGVVSASGAFATTLSFDGRYDSKNDFVGADTTPQMAVRPFVFSFTVDFSLQVTSLLGPDISSSPYPAPDGSFVNYTGATANTVFGAPTFSQSPISSELPGNTLPASILPGVSNQSQSTESEAFNHWDSQIPSYGAKAISFEAYFQIQPVIDSLERYTVYVMEVGVNVEPAPASLDDVGHIQVGDFLNLLLQARDRKAAWNMDEFGQYHSADSDASRVGSMYFGVATLVAVDGQTAPTPVPLPGSYVLMLTGIGLIAHVASRRLST